MIRDDPRNKEILEMAGRRKTALVERIWRRAIQCSGLMLLILEG
jgi:hypothetical protein